MYIESASPTVKNTTFSHNDAGFRGGGLYNENTSATVDSCHFSNNKSASGGGMFNSTGASPAIAHCVFEDNTATSSGGGMMNITALPCPILNCMFRGNEAANQGGGIYNIASSPDIINCAFLENTADEGAGISNQAGSNPPHPQLLLPCQRGGGNGRRHPQPYEHHPAHHQLHHLGQWHGGGQLRTGASGLLFHCQTGLRQLSRNRQQERGPAFRRQHRPASATLLPRHRCGTQCRQRYFFRSGR